MTDLPAVKTMRLRYAGTCSECGSGVEKGEKAHYLRATKTVRCLKCGTGEDATPVEVGDTRSGPLVPEPPPSSEAPIELAQGAAPRGGVCGDCERRITRGVEALLDASGAPMLCLECVTLDTVHVLGVAGGGARREHAKRLERHQTRVRTAHPRLGGVILALKDDPSYVQAWKTGAAGEEQFGGALSSIASEPLKVLHDRKLPRSAANIDHLAVTTEGVWILDSKRYKGRVETRGHGLFSRRPPDLYVGGRNQMKLVAGVQRQVEIVQSLLAESADDVPVRGALVFVDADFGLFPSPLAVDGVWVGWGKAIRRRLAGETGGEVFVDALAKHLASKLRAG